MSYFYISTIFEDRNEIEQRKMCSESIVFFLVPLLAAFQNIFVNESFLKANTLISYEIFLNANTFMSYEIFLNANTFISVDLINHRPNIYTGHKMKKIGIQKFQEA